jgi:hypothetical protein
MKWTQNKAGIGAQKAYEAGYKTNWYDLPVDHEDSIFQNPEFVKSLFEKESNQ